MGRRDSAYSGAEMSEYTYAGKPWRSGEARRDADRSTSTKNATAASEGKGQSAFLQNLQKEGVKRQQEAMRRTAQFEQERQTNRDKGRKRKGKANARKRIAK